MTASAPAQQKDANMSDTPPERLTEGEGRWIVARLFLPTALFWTIIWAVDGNFLRGWIVYLAAGLVGFVVCSPHGVRGHELALWRARHAACKRYERVQRRQDRRIVELMLLDDGHRAPLIEQGHDHR